jgi:transcriptional regulator with XRE-family HTH domain
MGTRKNAKKQGSATAAIKKAIAESGLPLREIARRSGVDVGVISRLIAGSRTPTLETADRIIDALGLDVELKPRQAKLDR